MMNECLLLRVLDFSLPPPESSLLSHLEILFYTIDSAGELSPNVDFDDALDAGRHVLAYVLLNRWPLLDRLFLEKEGRPAMAGLERENLGQVMDNHLFVSGGAVLAAAFLVGHLDMHRLATAVESLTKLSKEQLVRFGKIIVKSFATYF